jgi:hypothetical protein
MMEKTNELLEELLQNIRKSNRILMSVNAVNVMTILVLVIVLVIK